MATTIINPAQFNSGGGNSIRSAFNTEGYGVSTSFFAYRQGGGIVPATAAFDGIGAGTVGDPLRMSQFSGFVVPSQLAVSFAASYTIEGAAFTTTSSSTTCVTRFTLLSNGNAEAEATAGGFAEFGDTNELAVDAVVVADSSSAGLLGPHTLEQWLDAGSAGDVSVFVTSTGSTLLAGSAALSTYLALSTDRTWSLRAARFSSGFTSAAATLTVQFVETANTANVLDTATVYLSASASS